MSSPVNGQAAESVERNREFFARDVYSRNAQRLDSHARIRAAVTDALRGTDRLLDVGNGGVFEYDTSVVGEIVACDLFLDEAMNDQYPENASVVRGDALDLPPELGLHDVVIEAFLYHHLTGRRAGDSVGNVRRAIEQAVARLLPGGRLVVVESCIPPFLYPLERALYSPLRQLSKTRLLGGHPATLQLPIAALEKLIAAELPIESSKEIPLGRWVTQFGRRFPAALTPVRAHLIVARKPT